MMKFAGTLFEQKFVVECLTHGLHPHPSIGDYLPHDLIVQNTVGRCFRVQVKGTDTLVKNAKHRTGRYRITAKAGKTKNRIGIDCMRVDVVSAFVAATNTWYNIPCTKLASQVVWLYPEDDTSKGQYEKYRNRWDVFS